MGKTIVIRDDLAQKLDQERKRYGWSYSQIIERMMKNREKDEGLYRISEKYEEIQKLMPKAAEIIELERVIVANFSKVAEEKEDEIKEEILQKLAEALEIAANNREEVQE